MTEHSISVGYTESYQIYPYYPADYIIGGASGPVVFDRYASTSVTPPRAPR